MIEFQGRFGKAKVFTNMLDDSVVSQIYKILDSDLAKDSSIRIMPDTHAGAGGPIGLTMTVIDKIAPTLVGSDIGCGVGLYGINLGDVKETFTLEMLDEVINEMVPSGYHLQKFNPDIYEKISDIFDRSVSQRVEDLISNLKVINNNPTGLQDLLTKSFKCLGTLGGGNHFIEAYEGDNEYDLYLSVHTGSRSIGGIVYKYYNRLSINSSYIKFLEERQEIIKDLKSKNRESEISASLDRHKLKYTRENSIDKNIKYLMGESLKNYLHDVTLLTEFAALNRLQIVRSIIKGLGTNCEFTVIADKPHNYVTSEEKILRKGAQDAKDKVLIPINMRDGIIIGHYRDEETLKDWNYSAPHGAGRRLSRTQAFNELDLEVFKEQMKGIYSTTVNEDTLDEAPDAYKSLEEIQENILENIIIDKVLKPIYNFKGGKERPPLNNLGLDTEENSYYIEGED